MVSIGFTSGINDKTLLPEILTARGLSTYEYGAGRGSMPNYSTIIAFKNSNFKYSIHSPYYMSMTNEDKLDTNLEMIERYCSVAPKMNVDRIIVHAGNLQKQSRIEAERIALTAFKECTKISSKYGVTICPETVGKYNTYGNTTEVIRLCRNIPELIPCFDIGHMNSVSNGSIHKYSKKHWLQFLNIVDDNIGVERTKQIHWHVSKIIYSNCNEVKHVDLTDNAEPNYEPLLEALADYKSDGRIICESGNTPFDDAIRLNNYYQSVLIGE